MKRCRGRATDSVDGDNYRATQCDNLSAEDLRGDRWRFLSDK